MKKVVLVLVFAVLAAGGVFAQGFIKPTFSVGFGHASSHGYGESGLTAAFDVDFVNDFGLTLGLQNIFMGNSDFSFTAAAFGPGYTYDAGKWCVGGKFMIVPVNSGIFTGWGAGFDVNGTYWFMNNLGVTGILDLYFPDEAFSFSFRVGISFKY